MVTSEKNCTFKGIYYQDENMKTIYSYIPEIMRVDVTYKLNEMRMSVFLQMVIDGNGESEIVAVFIVVLEDAETISKMVEIFKSHNPNWSQTKTIVTDKDLVERAVYSEQFPDAMLHLCIFHVLRSMRREINVEK